MQQRRPVLPGSFPSRTKAQRSPRGLRRNPGFTATAILVLALAIGAATAAFTVVRTVLWSDLPYPHADRLMRVYEQNSPTNRWTLSVVDVQAIAAGKLEYAIS